MILMGNRKVVWGGAERNRPLPDYEEPPVEGVPGFPFQTASALLKVAICAEW
jgi:hypothetical protein